MPTNTDVNVPTETWTPLTADGITSARVQNRGGYFIHIQATAGTEPSGATALHGSIVLNAGQILPGDMTLADLFPGVAGASQLWAYAVIKGKASVSHA